MSFESTVNNRRSEQEKGVCLATTLHPTRAAAELHVRRERADGNRARFFPRAVKADNREILCWAVVVRHAGPRIGGAS